MYFVNDLLEAALEPLARRLSSALLSSFVLPCLAAPLVPHARLGGEGPSHVLHGGASEAAPSPAGGEGSGEGSGAGSGAAGGEAEVLALLCLALFFSARLSRRPRRGRRSTADPSHAATAAGPQVLSHAPLLDALATLFLHPALRLDAVSTPLHRP